MLSRGLGVLFALLLVAGVPALSWKTAHDDRLRALSRPALYFSAALSQWVLTFLGLAVGLVTLPGFSAAGFRATSLAALAFWALLISVVSLTGLGAMIVLERRGLWPAESEWVYRLLPGSRREKVWSVLVLAPTAAFCEEFLYRGYLLVVVSGWLHSATAGWVTSSVAFGLAHVYQGASGTVRAGLLGALLAYPMLRLGSLYPGMLAHFLIDALALAWLGPEFLGRNP